MNGELYVFGGAKTYKKPKRYSNKLHKYDPIANEWIELANMPEAKETKGVFIDGKL